MRTFNIVNPDRKDFAKAIVSPEATTSKSGRKKLVAYVRALIERSEVVAPTATKKYTSEQLTEMGFVGLAVKD